MHYTSEKERNPLLLSFKTVRNSSAVTILEYFILQKLSQLKVDCGYLRENKKTAPLSIQNQRKCRCGVSLTETSCGMENNAGREQRRVQRATAHKYVEEKCVGRMRPKWLCFFEYRTLNKK